jgi:hypothetical protein
MGPFLPKDRGQVLSRCYLAGFAFPLIRAWRALRRADSDFLLQFGDIFRASPTTWMRGTSSA